MPTPPAPGSANTPGAAPPANGAPPADDQAPPPRTAEELAAEADAAAADAAAANANGEAPPDDDAGHGRRHPSERIKEVVGERNAAMEWGRYWYDIAQGQLKGGAPAPGAAPAAAAPPAAKPRPLLKDFKDADEWADAVTTWTEERIERGVENRLSTVKQTEQQSAAAAQWDARVADYRKTAPDFDAVVSNPKLPISNVMLAAAMNDDLGPQVLHHLGKNPTEALRIFRLPQAQQVQAIGKLSGRLEAAAPPAPKGGKPAGGAPPPPPANRSRAPEPPSPNRPGGSSEVNLANCSLEEYLEKRLPQISRSGGGGKR